MAKDHYRVRLSLERTPAQNLYVFAEALRVFGGPEYQSIATRLLSLTNSRLLDTQQLVQALAGWHHENRVSRKHLNGFKVKWDSFDSLPSLSWISSRGVTLQLKFSLDNWRFQMFGDRDDVVELSTVAVDIVARITDHGTGYGDVRSDTVM